MSVFKIIPPQTPLVDRNGIISREWWRFLNSMFMVIGGNGGTTNVTLADVATLAAIDFALPDDPSRQIADLQILLASVPQADADFSRQIADLQTAIAALPSPIDFFRQIADLEILIASWPPADTTALPSGVLSNVLIVSPATGQVLAYNGTTGQWNNVSETLEDLFDVAVTTPTNGQVLTYNSGTSKWSNVATKAPLFDISAGVPALSAFTWLNQNVATITEFPGKALYLTSITAGQAVEINAMFKAVPTAPYRIATLIMPALLNDQNASAFIGFYDGSSKVQIFGFAGDGTMIVENWSSPTAYVSEPAGSTGTPWMGAQVWLAIADDGAGNVSYEYSMDSVNWITFYTVAKSAGYLGSTGYVKALFGINPDPGSIPIASTLRVWDENGLTRAFP